MLAYKVAIVERITKLIRESSLLSFLLNIDRKKIGGKKLSNIKKVIFFGFVTLYCLLFEIIIKLTSAFPAVESGGIGHNVLIFAAAASISIASVYAFRKED